MKRAELVRHIERRYGAFPTISNMAEFMKKSRTTVREMFSTLERFDDGRAQRFYSGDVADEILRRRVK